MQLAERYNIERQINAAIIQNGSDAIVRIIDRIQPRHFQSPIHAEIYQILQNLFNSGKPIDLTVVHHQYKYANPKATPETIAEILLQYTDDIILFDAIEEWADITIAAAQHRDIDQLAKQLLATNNTPQTPDDRISYILKQLAELTTHKNKPKPIADVVVNIISTLDTPTPDGITGVPSGFSDLDQITAGFQPGTLNIIGARPGMGKTALMLALARAAAAAKHPAVIVSLEMTAKELGIRLIAAETKYPSQQFKRRQISPTQIIDINYKLDHLITLPIYIDDTPAITIHQLRTILTQMKIQYDIRIAFIDYLQLISPNTKSNAIREQEISQISRELKAIAKQLNIPIIALAQLSRSVETRGGDKRPQLSDLRESGSIEADADTVAFLYRPEYYGINQDQNGNSTAGVTELIIAKNRDGALDTIRLHFDPTTTQFQPLYPDITLPTSNPYQSAPF